MGKDTSEKKKSPPPKGKLGRQQRIGVLIALGIMAIGAALWILGPAWAGGDSGKSGGAGSGGGSGGSSLVQGLAPGGVGDGGETEKTGDPGILSEVSPAVFQLGFSFVVAFAIAYAARTFLRITLIAVGGFLLVLFGLEYVDIVTVNWETMEEHYNNLLASARESFSGFKEFVTGRLPSAGSALAGLVVGFRRK